MNFFDILRLSWRNLREAKARVALTTMGVVVGVTVIVTMISFGLGLQRNAVQRFKDLDLFNEITVSGRDLSELVETMMNRAAAGGGAANDNDRAAANANASASGNERANANESANANANGPADGQGSAGQRRERRDRPNSPPLPARASVRALDDAALAEIARVPGVESVEPSINFTAYVRAHGRSLPQTVGGALVPNAATRFKGYAAGQMIAAPAAAEAVVDERFVRDFGFANPAAAVGQTIELLAPPRPAAQTDERSPARRSTRPEATDPQGDELSFFGLPLAEVAEADGAAAHVETRSFRIAGVLRDEVEGGVGGGRRVRGLMPAARIYVPLAAARTLAAEYRDPLSQVALQLARASGALGAQEGEGYNSAVVRVTNPDVLPDVRRRLTQLGFSSFSIVDELEEIRTFFLIVNSALGLLGGISLLVASFGIANTMIMAILERTREIGIMKAIGAEDREIKLIFFVEAGLIGLLGGSLGALAAWGIDAVANRLAYRFLLRPRGVSFVNFFDIPVYLWLGAILFAVVISILAALYPAARAARIDPVKALRHD